MSGKDFQSFVFEQHRKAAAQQADNAKSMSNWLHALEGLYDQIAEYLRPYTDLGTILLTDKEIDIVESGLGLYTAKQLTLKIGASEVELTPIGTMVFGAEGRVDLRGPLGAKKILLVPSDVTGANVRILSEQQAFKEANEQQSGVKLVWKISDETDQNYLDLTQITFTDTVMDLIG